MKAIVFCLICAVCMLSRGNDAPQNYYHRAATLLDDFSQVPQLRNGEIKISCSEIISDGDSKTYQFRSSLNGEFAVVVAGFQKITKINNFNAPDPLRKKISENSEWLNLSRSYFDKALSKVSLLSLVDMEIAKNVTIYFVIENVDDSTFSIFCPQSQRKRIIRYLAGHLLQITDYEKGKVLQQIIFTPKTASIYRMYIIGEAEATFFENGSIQYLIEYDKDSKKAVRGREWSEIGSLLHERDFIKNPRNYNNIKFQQ